MSAEKKGPGIDNKVIVRPWKITPAQAEREKKVDRAVAETKRRVLYEVGRRETEYRVDRSSKEYAGLEGETLKIMSENDPRYKELEIRLEVKAHEEIVYYTKAGETRYAKVKRKALEKIR